MRHVFGPGALGRPRVIRWRGTWEGGSGCGIHVNPWLIHVNIWKNPLQYCKVIGLQLIKINGKTKTKTEMVRRMRREIEVADCFIVVNLRVIGYYFKSDTGRKIGKEKKCGNLISIYLCVGVLESLDNNK